MDLSVLTEENMPPTAAEAAAKAEAPENENTSVKELSVDTAFSILKNSRRRDVLRYLKTEGETSTIRDITEYVAGREKDESDAHLSYKERKRVYVALYQCHLPMMDKAGVIEFNKARGRVELTPVADQLDEYLVDEQPVQERWDHYLTVTTFGGLLYVFGTLLFGPGSLFTTLTVIWLIGAVMGLALLQARQSLARGGSIDSPVLIRYPKKILANVLGSVVKGTHPDTNPTGK